MLEIRIPGYLIQPISHTAEDLSRLLAVYRQCEDFLSLGPIANASLEMVQADLALSRQQEGEFCAIVDLNSVQFVGVVDYIPAGFEGDPAVGFLSLLMIAAPHRRHGLGAAVVQAVEQVIRCDECVRSIQAGVQVNNPLAIRFWQRMGYAIISGPEPMPDGTSAFRLEKKL